MDYDAKLEVAIKAAKRNGSARKRGRSPAPVYISRRGSKVPEDTKAPQGGSAWPDIRAKQGSSWQAFSWLYSLWQTTGQTENMVTVKI